VHTPVHAPALLRALLVALGAPELPEAPARPRPDGETDLARSSAGATSEAREPVAAAPAAGLRVLLAEDNPVNQKVALRLLEKFGCTVQIAGTGSQAVAAALHGRFDLVLMDCQMPDMDGFEATAEIRRRELDTGHRTRIVALTANAMSTDAERCRRAGMDGYISKPYKPAELLDVLTSAAPR